MATEKELIVGIPLYQGCTLVDFAGATQVFARTEGMKVIWLCNDASVNISEGVTVLPNYSFDYHPDIDILFVPGGGPEGVLAAMQNPDLLQFIQKNWATTQWRGSVCTGAFILAAAGVLRDCEATTYWSQIPTLQLLAQKFNLEVHDHYYPRSIIDENQCIFTGGGISSALDLALDLVIKIKGVPAAEAAQLMIQYQPEPALSAGIPSGAPPEIVAAQMKGGEEYREMLMPAIEKILAG